MHTTEIQQGKETENPGKMSEVTDNGFLPAYYLNSINEYV